MMEKNKGGDKIEAGPRAFWGSSIAKSAILFSIIKDENAVYDIAQQTGIYPTAVKQHVNALREEGVITASEPGKRERVEYSPDWQALAQVWLVYRHGWSNFADYRLLRMHNEEGYARKDIINDYLHTRVRKDEQLVKLADNKEFASFVQAYLTTIAKYKNRQRQITIKNAFTEIFQGVYPVLKEKKSKFDFLSSLVSKIDEIDAEKIANDTIEIYNK